MAADFPSVAPGIRADQNGSPKEWSGEDPRKGLTFSLSIHASAARNHSTGGSSRSSQSLRASTKFSRTQGSATRYKAAKPLEILGFIANCRSCEGAPLGL
jgi:hypothetical protein